MSAPSGVPCFTYVTYKAGASELDIEDLQKQDSTLQITEPNKDKAKTYDGLEGVYDELTPSEVSCSLRYKQPSHTHSHKPPPSLTTTDDLF